MTRANLQQTSGSGRGLVVVGSVALDSVDTPTGVREHVLGGKPVPQGVIVEAPETPPALPPPREDPQEKTARAVQIGQGRAQVRNRPPRGISVGGGADDHVRVAAGFGVAGKSLGLGGSSRDASLEPASVGTGLAQRDLRNCVPARAAEADRQLINPGGATAVGINDADVHRVAGLCDIGNESSGGLRQILILVAGAGRGIE